MKKIWKAGLVAVMASTALVGCGSGDTTASADCPIRVGFVTDVGGIDDKSFNQGSWEGIQKWQQENNLSEDCIKFIQSNEEAQYVPNLSSLADEGYDLIIASGFLFNDAMNDVAPKYPDTKFFVIDTVVEQDNVESGMFAAEQSSYLAGVAAAMQAKAEGGDTIGFVGGMDDQLIKTFQAGYEQGAKSVDPEIKIMVDYASSFNDPSKGQTLAEKQYNAGARVVYHSAGNTGSGVIKAAKERSQAGNPVWVIGVDRDQYEDGIYDGDKSVILTSALKRVDVATYEAAAATAKGEFNGGTTVNFDILNDGVGVPSENPNLSKEIQDKLNSVVEEIKSGKITISTEATIANGQVG